MAKHRAKFGWPLLNNVGAVMKPTCETRWNLVVCPKLVNWSQPLMGRISLYCENMWRRYCCLTSFFRLSIHALVAKIQPDKVVMVGRWRIFDDFLCPVFSASRLQHISDLHSKFALGPHHVWKYGRHPICDGWEQARKKDGKKKSQDENIMTCPFPQGGDNQPTCYFWHHYSQFLQLLCY